MTFFPHTKVGAWGLSLSVVYAMALAATILFALPIPSSMIFGVGIVGVLLNVIALFRNERSLVFYVLGGAISSLVIFWGLAEVLFPH